MYGLYRNGSVIAQFAAPLTVTSNEPVFIGDAQSLKRAVFKRPAQRWEITTNLSPLSTTADELFSWMVMRGHHSIVQVIMPQNTGVVAKRSYTSTPFDLKGSAGVTDSSITLLFNNLTIPQGTFIRTESHTKIYMVTETLYPNELSLKIFPNIRKDFTNSGLQIADDVIGNFYFDTDTVIGMSYTDGILMDNGTIKLIEAL